VVLSVRAGGSSEVRSGGIKGESQNGAPEPQGWSHAEPPGAFDTMKNHEYAPDPDIQYLYTVIPKKTEKSPAVILPEERHDRSSFGIGTESEILHFSPFSSKFGNPTTIHMVFVKSPSG
jgi:hypothetical protein